MTLKSFHEFAKLKHTEVHVIDAGCTFCKGDSFSGQVFLGVKLKLLAGGDPEGFHWSVESLLGEGFLFRADEEGLSLEVTF